MNYKETLEYIFAKLPMFSRVGAPAYKAGLDNIIALCNAIGNPQESLKCIHVGGTNGKGSTSHLIASILQESGFKVGLYTSPHIFDFRERIMINGIFIPEEEVVQFIENNKQLIETLEPSFFEITVAMAFAYFAKQQTDYCIIEVGMGGRLDSTNIIAPLLSIITNISKDHTQFLGDTIAKIAIEKAGIIKQNTPIIIGESVTETETIFRNTASILEAPIFFADKIFDIIEVQNENPILKTYKIVNRQLMTILKIETNIIGQYQKHNLKTVLQACTILQAQGIAITEKKIVDGIAHVKHNTQLKGRFDILQQQPFIIADVAHNVAGISEVLAQINKIPHHALHIICGFVADKALEEVLPLMPQHATYYFTQAHIPRALDKNMLMQKAKNFNLIGDTYADVNNALQAAKHNATTEDVILVIGSFFLLGEMKK
jgi:dihydrofolate synthase / folylpolyglutamate synthase